MVILTLYAETITIIQYQMYQISFENANTSEMEVISSLLIDDISFYCLIIYNGRNYKNKYMNLIPLQLMKPIKKQ